MRVANVKPFPPFQRWQTQGSAIQPSLWEQGLWSASTGVSWEHRRLPDIVETKIQENDPF